MPRKPRVGEQLATGNMGDIKDVGGDRLRPGIVTTASLAPPTAPGGGGGGAGTPPSLYSGGTPAQIDIGDAASDGTSPGFARGDHQHALPAPTAGYPVDVAATEADGASTRVARGDHRHAHGTGYAGGHTDYPAAGTTPTQIDVGDAQTGGAASTFSKNDHQHALLAPAAPTTSAFADAAAAGASAKVAREDHLHGREANPVTAHEAAGDPHTGYQKESEKDAASGYAGLNASSRTTKGVDTTDDLIVDLATKGLVLKDTQGSPHYWRVTISTLGVLVTTDLGTSKP